jgi:hypothetical protein
VKLAAEEYYDNDRPVQHTAQGDLHVGIPFTVATLGAEPSEARGSRKRPALMEDVDGAFAAMTPLIGLGVVCTYTCGFVAQPPGTNGYAHPYRQVAPVLPLRDLKESKMPNGELRRIRDEGGTNGFMYLPLDNSEDERHDDEWSGHGAICLYFMTTVTQDLLDSRPRTGRLSQEAQRLLNQRLIQLFTPNFYDPHSLAEPDISDSWGATASPGPG